MTDFTKPSKQPFIIGVSGGSGSGKTYFAKALFKMLKSLSVSCEIVCQDNFYIDQSKRFDYDGGSVNFDHPESIDFLELAQCLRRLKNGDPAQIPTYDFATHRRKKETILIPVPEVVIVDGILIFHSDPVREIFDDLIYFDTPEQLRFQRRLHRDVNERGRTQMGVNQQFFKQVKPMHDEFVEPSKSFAKTIIKDTGHFDDVLIAYCEKWRK